MQRRVAKRITAVLNCWSASSQQSPDDSQNEEALLCHCLRRLTESCAVMSSHFISALLGLHKLLSSFTSLPSVYLQPPISVSLSTAANSTYDSSSVIKFLFLKLLLTRCLHLRCSSIHAFCEPLLSPIFSCGHYTVVWYPSRLHHFFPKWDLTSRNERHISAVVSDTPQCTYEPNNSKASF